jgi:hypothetical protein
MDVAEKPTLVQLLNRHRVNMIRLARVTRVQVGAVRAMAKRSPVPEAPAQQVLSGFEPLVGVRYTLQEVDVVLWQEQAGGRR